MKKLITLFTAIIVSVVLFGQSQTFTSSTSWTPPAGVTSITVECWGGGGGGGYGGGTNKYGGGGGGGGAYNKGTSIAVTTGTSYTLTVGTGGAGGTAATQNGGTGNISTATFGATTVSANGGGGGQSYTNGRAGGAGGTGGLFSGGAGAAGTTTYSGGGGEGAAPTVNGNPGSTSSGGTGTAGGDGGAGNASNAVDGLAGSIPGGGGGGGTKSSLGGAGASGQIIISYTCPTYSLTATSASSPVFVTNSSTVTVTGNAANLPVGTYTVTYNLSAPNAVTGATAAMTVSTAGTGTFTTSALANAGATTLTITNIASGGCSSAISSNNTSVITVSNPPTYCTNTNTSSTSYFIDDFSTSGGTSNITNNNSGFSTNGYGNFTGMTAGGVQGTSLSFSMTSGYGTIGLGIWIDWNQDGDFADAGEEAYMTTGYVSTTTGTINIPVTALTGTTRMRIVGDYYDSSPVACTGTTSSECEDYSFSVTAATPMSYVSSTVTQAVTSSVYQGSLNQEIIGIQIVTSGTASPLSVTSFTVNAAGSTNINDINAANSAKIYYTGTSSTFALTTLFGQNTPTVANYNITGSQVLATGTNYFWLVYDVKVTATVGDVIDAQCTSLTVGSARTPSVTSPAGSRPIVAAPVLDGTFSSGTNFTANAMTVVNNATNYWIVGTATHNGAPNSAYITNDGSANTYTTSVSQVSHFYFDYNFPAGQTIINMSFDWKAVGESCCDYLQVFLVPTSTTPVAGTTLSSGQLGSNYNSQSAWQTVNLTLDGANAGTTKRIVFSWRNDGSVGTDPPAAVDNILITTAAPSGMVYNSCTTTQTVTSDVSINTTSQQIIGVQIVTTGTLSPLNATSFTFNTTGTTAPATDITNAKLWYTGTSSTFATTTQVGSTVAAPSGSYNITGSQALSEGTNYFWLTYDIPAGATINNYVDAQCTSLTVGSARTPTVTDPAGNRKITLNYCTATFSDPDDEWITNVTFNTINNNSGANLPNKYGDYTAISTTVTQGNTYALSVDFDFGGTAYGQDVMAYFDWNRDGDFTDGDEFYLIANDVTAGPVSLNITIPTSTINGTTRMRIISTENDTYTPCPASTYGETEDYTININALPMAFVSSTTTQANTTDVMLSTTNQVIIGVEIVTSGSLTPFTVSSFTFTTAGTTAPATDITNARLWSTGNSSTFATTTQLGATVAAPGAGFTINSGAAMPLTLLGGTNYFWLTYDIPAGATVNNMADASCTSLTANGIVRTPTVTNPGTGRKIVDCPLGTGAYYVTLPYSANNHTTQGNVNDITSSNVTNICGSSLYYGGMDCAYVFTPSSSGSVTIDLTDVSGSYSGVTLYQGCPTGGGTCVAYAQSSSADKSLCASVTSGLKYYLVIDSYPSPDYNQYDLDISNPTGTTTGFTCATPHSIAALPFTVTGLSTACSGNDYTSASTGACSSSYLSGEDYVFQYTATGSECVSITLSGCNSYSSFSVYDDCPGTASATCLGTYHNAAAPFSGSVTFPSAGTYYIVIDTDGSGSMSTPFDLSITSNGSGPVNDLPCNATSLDMGQTASGNLDCSSGGEISSPACWTTGAQNIVWYSFVAPGSGSVDIITHEGTLDDTQIALYTGTCSSLTYSTCNADVPACGSQNYNNSLLELTGLTPGATYFIAVDGENDLVGTFTITLADGTIGLPLVFGQDCGINNAIPVCANSFPVGDPGYQAVGNYCDNAGSHTDDCTSGERGAAWYHIKIGSNGVLEFTLIPNDYDGTNETDYDFLLYKMVGSGAVTCAQIANATAGPIRCDFDADGITGLYSATDETAPPPYSPNYDYAFEPRLDVVAGEEYFLVIQNYSNSNSGFSIDFGTSPLTYPTLATITQLTWTGGAGTTDWFTPLNWGDCAAIPNENIDAIIAPSSSFQPVIDRVNPWMGFNARAKSLIINPSASLTIDPGFIIEVYGNYNNTGDLNAFATSTVQMKGTASQTMDGNLTGTSAFQNFTVNKGAGSVLINQDFGCDGNFLTSSGTSIFNSNGKHVKVGGNFTIASLATYTGVGSTGILEFMGTSLQTYTTTGGTLTLNSIIMNNTGAGVIMNNHMYAGTSGTFTFTSGVLNTNGYIAGSYNTTPGSATAGNSTSWVNGTFRKYITNNTGTYNLPVGSATRYTLAQLKNNNLTGITYLDAKFNTTFSNGGTINPALAIDFGTSYTSVCSEGVWQIDPNTAATGGSYDILLYFNGSGTFAGLLDNQFGPLKRASSSVSAADWAGQSIGTLSATGTPGRTLAGGYARRNGITAFSQYAIGIAPAPLPIELLDFYGVCKNDYIELNWSTSAEINNDFFTVEKSYNGTDWKILTTVPGAGFSNEILHYDALDYEINNNHSTVYYRIRQTDFDGTTTVSQVISMNCYNMGGETVMFISSALENENIVISFNGAQGKTYEVMVVDMLGRKLFNNRITITEETQRFDINKEIFSAGLYNVVIQSNTDLITKQIVIPK